MRNNFTYVGSGYLILIKENKILLQRRYNTGFEDGNYGIPAGHLDGGETAKIGTARECAEEIGITINPEDLQVVHVMHRKATNDERIDFFMVASKFTGEIVNQEPHKCDQLEWFSLDKLPDNIIAYVKQAIVNYNNNIFYSEHGWE